VRLCNSQRRERERERERGGGERRKSRVLFLVDDGSMWLIRCFSLYLIWCDNPSYLILIGGHKGAGLHKLLIEVILVYFCFYE
jgi:hypothetical protein